MGDDVARMAGTIVLEHRRLLQERLGPQKLARVLAKLPADVRDEYLGLTSLGWARVSTAEAVFRAAADELGRDVAELHEEVSRASVERTLRTVWRLLLRFTSDEALVLRTPRIYARSFQRGALLPAIVAPGRAEIRVDGWPDMPEFSTRGLRIGIETVLVLAGRRGVRVDAERRPDGPCFLARWDVA